MCRLLYLLYFLYVSSLQMYPSQVAPVVRVRPPATLQHLHLAHIYIIQYLAVSPSPVPEVEVGLQMVGICLQRLLPAPDGIFFSTQVEIGYTVVV